MKVKNHKFSIKVSPLFALLAAGILALAISYFAGIHDLFSDKNTQKVRRFFQELVLSKQDQLRSRWGDFYGQVSLIKQKTPQDSLILIPPPKIIRTSTEERLAENISHQKLTENFIFPRRTAYEGDESIHSHAGPIYWFDTARFRYRGKAFESVSLNGDHSLVLIKKRNGEPAVPHLTDFTDLEVGPFHLFAALLKLFLVVLSGSYFAGRYFQERSRLGFWASSFLMGTIVNTLLFLVFSMLRVPWSEFLQYGLLGIIAFVSRTQWLARMPRGKIQWDWASVLACAFLGFLFVKNFTSPIHGWDACAVYSAKAKALFAFHDLSALKTWGGNAHYPPLLPVMMSQLAIGGEGMVNILFPLFALCLYAHIRDEIEDTRYSQSVKTLLPLLIFTSGVFFYFALLGYPNFAFAVFVTKALALWSRALKENDTKQWFAFALMLCGAILVRVEGGAYWLLFLFLSVSAALARKDLRCRLAIFVIPCAVLVLWKLYAGFILGNALSPLASHASAILDENLTPITFPMIREVIFSFLRYTLMPSLWWGIIPFSFLLLMFFRGKMLVEKHRPEMLFGVTLLTGLFGLSVLLAPRWGIEFFFVTGFTRFAMPLVPILLIIVLKETDRLIAQRLIR